MFVLAQSNDTGTTIFPDGFKAKQDALYEMRILVIREILDLTGKTVLQTELDLAEKVPFTIDNVTVTMETSESVKYNISVSCVKKGYIYNTMKSKQHCCIVLQNVNVTKQPTCPELLYSKSEVATAALTKTSADAVSECFTFDNFVDELKHATKNINLRPVSGADSNLFERQEVTTDFLKELRAKIRQRDLEKHHNKRLKRKRRKD